MSLQFVEYMADHKFRVKYLLSYFVLLKSIDFGADPTKFQYLHFPTNGVKHK